MDSELTVEARILLRDSIDAWLRATNIETLEPQFGDRATAPLQRNSPGEWSGSGDVEAAVVPSGRLPGGSSTTASARRTIFCVMRLRVDGGRGPVASVAF